jgi:hypothetical protein
VTLVTSAAHTVRGTVQTRSMLSAEDAFRLNAPTSPVLGSLLPQPADVRAMVMTRVR